MGQSLEIPFKEQIYDYVERVGYSNADVSVQEAYDAFTMADGHVCYISPISVTLLAMLVALAVNGIIKSFYSEVPYGK